MIKKILMFIFTFSLMIVFAIPIIITITSSFNSENGKNGYIELLFNCFSFYPAFWNSVLYTVTITVMQLIIVIPAAFAFTQIKSKLISVTFFLYIVLMMTPLQVTLLPVYIGLRDLNLLDTRYGIIIPMIFSPMYAVIVKQYMNSINASIIDALMLETNSVFRVIISGIIPQIKPCIFAVILFSVAETWNMLEQPMQFLKQDKFMPLSVFINKSAEYGNGIMLSASVIYIIPMLLLYGYFIVNVKNNLKFKIK